MTRVLILSLIAATAWVGYMILTAYTDAALRSEAGDDWQAHCDDALAVANEPELTDWDAALARLTGGGE